MAIKDGDFREVYEYVDSLPLSRAKKNIARDFADGVLAAELVHHEVPRIIELHNYSSAHSMPQKMYNWNTLNQKVFKHHLHFSVPTNDLQAVSSCKAGAIEKLITQLRQRLTEYKHIQLGEGSWEHEARKSPDRGLKGLASQSSQSRGPVTGNRAENASELNSELQETNEILNMKIEKLEQLVQLKDAKIQALTHQLEAAA